MDDVAGVAYALNHLDIWGAAAGLDGAALGRLRAWLAGRIAGDARPSPTEAEPVAPETAPAQPAPRPIEHAPAELAYHDVRRWATEETSSLLLYVGAFLIVVSAFILVNVSGEQMSDLLKLLLMLAGTIGFLAAGVLCYRSLRVRPAGRTFLVIGALVTPLDVVAYYVLVAHASPLDAPTLWTLGSLVCSGLYAALRLGGYGIGYSYLFYGALLSAVLGAEAMVHLPLAWAAAPIAALAFLLERTRSVANPVVVALIGPLARMTSFVAAFVAIALLIPVGSELAEDRWAWPVEVALLTAYYVLRADAGAIWERIAASIGPGMVVLATAYALGADAATLGVVAVGLGFVYVSHDLVSPIHRALEGRARWATAEATWLGVALLLTGLVPAVTVAGSWGHDAIAYIGAAIALTAISLVWDERPGRFPTVQGHHLLAAALLALVLGHRFALVAVGVLPTGDADPVDLARAYAPLTLAAWAGVISFRSRAAHARVAAGGAGLLSLGVSLGSFDDPATHAGINLIYASGAAVVGLRRSHQMPLWIAAGAATLGTLGLARWWDVSTEWWPIFALVPGAAAQTGMWVRAIGRSHAALAQIAITSASTSALLGLFRAAAGTVPPWDTPIWGTTMVAIGAAGLFGALEARRRRSTEIGLASAIAVPLVIDMLVATSHPTLWEPITAPFAVYLLAAAWVARRSPMRNLAASADLLEYSGAVLALGPTVLRASDFGPLLLAGTIALAMLTAASRWQLAPTAHVAITALGALSVRSLGSNVRFDELRLGLGAALLALCAANGRFPALMRTPALAYAEVVAVALICLPTAAVVALFPSARDTDLPLALLLCIEVAAVLAVGVTLRRVPLIRAGLVVACVAALIFVALPRDGEWYAALVGSALVNAALVIRRRWPRALAEPDGAVLGAVGVGVLFLPSLGITIAQPELARTAQVLAGAIGVVIVAGLLGERWIAGAALGVAAFVGIVIAASPAPLQLAGIGGGAVMLGAGIGSPRFRRGGLPHGFATAFDALGLWLFVLPTFLLTVGSGPNTALQSAILMTQIVALFGTGLVFRAPVHLMAAMALFGIQSLRAIVDTVNRLPNWATFGLAGSLLLTIGFLLLLKRELFARVRRRFVRWWISWLATP